MGSVFHRIGLAVLLVFVASCGACGGDGPKKIVPCGNGELDSGETCDPEIEPGEEGACPTTCEQGSDDPCVQMTMEGVAGRCNVRCVEARLECGADDGCCPDSFCSASADPDCGVAALCGNGTLDDGEDCDPMIPTGMTGACECPGLDEVCTTVVIGGNPNQCELECTPQPVTDCDNGDGCCPSTCTPADDSDCIEMDVCGDGDIDPGETCDGNCPASCDDGELCTSDVMNGAAASCDVTCENTPIVTCVSGDGCCPTTCDATQDSDCDAICGNGIVEENETCDGNCPTSCDDNIDCTADSMAGSPGTCDVECANVTINDCVDDDGCCPSICDATNDNDCSATCGNGTIEPPETCDGDCPTTATCQPNDECEIATLSGSANNCNAECTRETIDACINDDGCCPTGCTFDMDNDCPCTPDTCASLGWTCGTVADDGCGGGGEFCGTCADNQDCIANICEDNFGIGEPCLTDTDCLTADAVCITQAETGWTGGYCSRACTSDLDCGAPNHCGSDGLCLRDCADDTDCRVDYACYDTDQDGLSECGPSGTGTGDVGDPCDSFADCGGGTEGWCGTEASQFKNGWCSRDCVTSSCPAGSHCSTNGYCVPDCTGTTSCRGNGYECYDHDDDGSQECFRFANGAGEVGEACIGMWDCTGGEWGWCVTDSQGWSGGYCTVLCGTGEGTCPSGATCYDDGNTQFCLDDCANANQCRTGYSCADPGNGQTACFP